MNYNRGLFFLHAVNGFSLYKALQQVCLQHSHSLNPFILFFFFLGLLPFTVLLTKEFVNYG
jgi:hypothetical protein